MGNYNKTYVVLDLSEYLFSIVEPVSLLITMGSFLMCGGVTLVGGAKEYRLKEEDASSTQRKW